jgi:hypothetical protein
VQIAFSHSDCLGGGFHKNDKARASAQGLNADTTASGKAVEKTTALNTALQEIK